MSRSHAPRDEARKSPQGAERDVGGSGADQVPAPDDEFEGQDASNDGARDGPKPSSRSAKAHQQEIARRKAATGTRRGDARAGFGKDPPPKGGRNKRGRGA